MVWAGSIGSSEARMAGALGRVVAGLVGRPVTAVPTGVGYGATSGGVAPRSLCSMVAPRAWPWLTSTTVLGPGTPPI